MSSQSSKQAWRVQTSRGELGPFSLSQLQKLAQLGTITRNSLLRDTKSTSWIRAEQIPSIFDLQASDSGSAEINSANVPSVAQPPSIPYKSSSETDARTDVPVAAIVSVSSGVAVALLLLGLVLITVLRDQGNVGELPSQQENSLATAAPSDGSSERPSPSTNSSSESQESVSPTAATKPQGSADLYSTEDLVTRTKESVALIATPTGFGSAFAVADGVVATNYHVIADCDADSIKVFFPDGPVGNRGPFAAQLVAEQPQRDLALLRIPYNAPNVEIDTTHSFRRGQDVIIIGSPGLFKGTNLLPNAVARGVLSSETDLDGYNHYQLSLAVNSGNSGGPVFGMDARVIGVVVSKSTSEESIGFCIPAVDLASLMRSQAAGNYAYSDRTAAEHDARVTIKAIAKQVAQFESFVDRMSELFQERSGRTPAELASADFVQTAKSIIAKEDPALFKDFSFQLRQILDDDRLSNRQHAEIETLMQRHNTIRKMLDNPPPNVQQLTNDLRRLGKQFFAQLEAVSRTLELQFP